MNFKDKLISLKDKGSELATKGVSAASELATKGVSAASEIGTQVGNIAGGIGTGLCDYENTITFSDVQGTFEGESAGILLKADTMVLQIGKNEFYTLPDDLTNIEFEYFEEEGKSIGGMLGKGALGLTSFAVAQSALSGVGKGSSVQSTVNTSIVAGFLGNKALGMDTSDMKGYMAMFMEFTDKSMFSARLPIKYWGKFKFEFDAFSYQTYKVEVEGEMHAICDDIVQLENAMKELGAKEKINMLKNIKERSLEVEGIQKRWDEVKSYAEQKGVATI